MTLEGPMTWLYNLVVPTQPQLGPSRHIQKAKWLMCDLVKPVSSQCLCCLSG